MTKALWTKSTHFLHGESLARTLLLSLWLLFSVALMSLPGLFYANSGLLTSLLLGLGSEMRSLPIWHKASLMQAKVKRASRPAKRVLPDSELAQFLRWLSISCYTFNEIFRCSLILAVVIPDKRKVNGPVKRDNYTYSFVSFAGPIIQPKRFVAALGATLRGVNGKCFR
ncbi:hypothetical protein Z042_17225 [Chania multitudinisentens RB-25]|uniref:Uncharacterized protein n=1 Tax=Chania multitudinisentens RB-25 TaxID=1441930 RepID=W0LGC9_9GAMM|nr:hypothetical protein Z042_17225 [Chania multitudinisentens RB-25]